MSEQTPYTPTTEGVRGVYARDVEELAEFNRWLAAHEQKVRAEAWAEGNEDAWCSGEDAVNPYIPKEPNNE